MATDKKCRFPQEQVEQGLDQTINSVDPVRAKSFQKMERMRTVKARVQERDRIRLSEKQGNDSPRVKTLQAKVATNQELARNLKLESARAQTEIPEVDENSWLVHGRVLNKRNSPVPGMKTALYDRSGCPIQTCGKEITDKKGHFNLSIKNVNDGVAGTASTTSTIDNATQQETMVGFVHVMDTNDVTVYEDKRPLPIIAGEAHYLEITLDDDGTGQEPGGETPPATKTRYLGNSNSKELHDLNNQKPGCRIDDIKFDHRVNFKTEAKAMALGYDYCAYCFGKDKSKR